MTRSRPTPALIVSIIALVVATAGTATAATAIITSSSQVKNGALTGADIKARSIEGIDIANETISRAKIKDGTITEAKLSRSAKAAASGAVAAEAVRRTGPLNHPPGGGKVATLENIPPGTYLLMAKSTLEADPGDRGLGELLRVAKTGSAECTLSLDGEEDKGRATVVSPGSAAPNTVYVQFTRTLDRTADAVLTCGVNDFNWRAADTSIVALKLADSTRTDVTG